VNIAVVAHRPGSRTPTGIDRYARELVGALAEHPEHTVEVVSTAERDDADWLPARVRIRRLRGPRKLLHLGWSLVGRPRIDAQMGDVQIVHVTAPTFPFPTARPVVYTVHDLLPRTHPEWFGRVHRWGFDRAIDAARDRAAAIIADSVATARAEELILAFGPRAVGRLAALTGDSRWFVQLRGARLLGKIAVADAVPLLQPLLRQSDPRVARQAVASLAAIQDPAAARAIQTVLRAASGEMRKAVTEALVAERDPRVVPMLVRILEESQPLGRDHDMVLETIDALGTVGTDGAVPILATLARKTSWFGRRKARALKERSIGALARVGTAKSTSAVQEAARQGDRMLRKIAAARVSAAGAGG